MKIDGELTVGAKFKVRIQPPGSKPQTFTPTVTAVDSSRRLAWLGRLIVPGILDGAHSLAIEPTSDTTCRFTQSEQFKGILVPLFRSLLRNTEAGFAAMNAALATRAAM